ncbi:proton channel OTOP3 [Hypanus sabinus]|uniref:proton channel OTOP3 n=1 Tax=Hypanus sabinus TaxID=79690 RepID=UPI0028C3A47F|nr:proton channel OTOP3 [Hypanus sabinus]
MVKTDGVEADVMDTNTSKPKEQGSTSKDGSAIRNSQSMEAAEKRSQQLSGLLAMNILFLGAAFVLSSIFNRSLVPGDTVLILLMVLASLAVGWMMYHQSITHGLIHRDLHAGAIWLRGAVLLFGVCTILLDAFKFGYYYQFRNSGLTVKIVYPVVEAIFVSTQTYLLWFHARDCIHMYQDATRCGLMVTLATDLVVWMTAVTDDSVHMELEAEQLASHNRNGSEITGVWNLSDLSCQSELCTIFQKGIVILYPFSIEFCLISSTMLYIMWGNVGRTIDHHETHTSYSFQGHGLVAGPLLGVTVIITGLVIFILYQMGVSADFRQPTPFIQFYIFNIVLLSAMSLCSLAALVVHRWEMREMDSRENPTRSLDVVLLQVAALGQLCISYFSIVAIVSTHPKRTIDTLNLTYSLLIIIEHMLQNLFIIEGLHRQCLLEDACQNFVDVCNKEFINLQNLKKQESPPSGMVQEPTAATISVQTNVPTKLSSAANSADGALDCSSILDQRNRALEMTSTLNWKRKLLKEISMFMIMSNLILWIMPAFGVQPQFENGLEKRFYGFSIWFAILNFGLPLGVFYRMHSAGNLLEIYLSA